MILTLNFCSKHNCTLEIVREDLEEWGDIWNNGSGLGIIGAVVGRRADVGMSSMLAW